jgi:hypothetical protein
VVASNVATVMPDVPTITAQVAPIGAQISLIMPHISTKTMGFSIVSVANRPAQLPPVLANITPVSVNVSPVMPPVNAVPTKISSVGANFTALAQRKRRSQHCKHHQTYDSSSHIASPVFPALWPPGRLNTGLGRKFWRPLNSRNKQPNTRSNLRKWGRKRQILEPSQGSA